jgi:hypothetical protein
MPHKGPKKMTSRELREEERQAEQRKAVSAAQKQRNEDEALAEYKLQRNPNMPASKGEQRALRRALKKEGQALEQWISPAAKSADFTVMQASELCAGYKSTRELEELYGNNAEDVDCDWADGDGS